MIYIDASALRLWLSCREHYRYKYVQGIKSSAPEIHREIGIALHMGVDQFWQGAPYEKALLTALEYTEAVTLENSTPKEQTKWKEMVNYLPDLIQVYYDSKKAAGCAMDGWLEREWSVPFSDAVTLCGRVDRYAEGNILVDVKTASEIGRTWKDDYYKSMLRDPGLGLYDWYFRQQGIPPKAVYLEVLIKPYGTKGSRLEIFEMKEIVSEGYRRRFDQQLAWMVSEIQHYHENYREQAPWPMSATECLTKYGHCPMLEACTYGISARNERKFKEYVPHLEVMK